MATDISSKGCLPNGWIVKASNKHPDRVYYFNLITGVSTWGFPKLDSARSSTVSSHKLSDVSFLSEDKTTESKDNNLRPSIEKKTVNNWKEVSFSNNETEGCNFTDSTIDQICSSNNDNEYSKLCISVEEHSNSNRKTKKYCELKAEIKDLQSKINDLNKCDTKTFEGLKTNYSSAMNENSNLQQSVINYFEQEDVEILYLSKNLTRIDDLPTEQYANYFIVVDTNIFIKQLNIIDKIKDMSTSKCGLPNFFIPWVVIQELNNLKIKSLKISEDFKGASEAMKYVKHMITVKHPRFHLQSPKEMKEWAQTFSINNDDRVLECCLNLVDRLPPENVMLLTDDINLANKAIIIGIAVFDFTSFLKHINFKKINTSTLVLDKPISKQNSPIAVVKEDSQYKKLNGIMLKAKQLLKDVLYQFFEAEMFYAYGEIWKTFEIDVNLLQGILNAIDKYWKTVFSFHFAIGDKQKFDFLQEITNRPCGFICTKKECCSILYTIQEIFFCIKNRWPKIDMPGEHIQKLIIFLNDPLKTDIQNYELKSDEHNVTLNVLDHIWTVINHLCGMVMDFYGIHHRFSYKRPDVFPPEDALDLLICRLHPAVERLKTLMSKLVIKNSPNKQISILGSKFYNKFHRALLECVPSLDIECVQPLEMQHPFTAEALQHFCQSEGNQEKLLLGYKQIETYYSKLEEVLWSMTITK